MLNAESNLIEDTTKAMETLPDPKLNMANLYSLPPTQTQIPIQTPFSDIYHDYFNGMTQSPVIHPSPEKPSFGESVAEGFAENDLNIMYRYQQSHLGSDNPLDDPVPQGWKASDELEKYQDLDSQYFGYLLSATSPKDSKRKYYEALEMQMKDRRYAEGSMIGHAIGLLGGGIVSPSSWIPIGLEIKAARLSTRLAQDIPKVIPGVAAASATHEAIVQTNDIKGNLEDFAIDTFRDTIIGTAFMGTLIGLGHGYTATKMWNARRVVNEIHNGIELQPVVKEDGSFSHLLATSNDGSVSAAEISFAQDFANSTMAKEGLFGVPVIGGWLGKGAGTFNPIIRMMNSPFQVMRGFIDRAADHGIVTEGNVKGIASPDKFEVKMAALNGDNKKFMWWLKGLHLERNGIDPGKRVRGAFTETKMRWADDAGYVNPEEFMDEIQGVLTNEIPSKHAAVNTAAEAMRFKMDESYKAFREAHNLPPEWLPPKTARGYLSRVYDVEYMKINEDKWTDTLVAYLRDADATINNHMQPIRELREQYKAAEERHQAYIRTPKLTSEEIKASADNVLGIKRQLKKQEEAVQDMLRSNDDLRIHVEDVGALSAKEAKQLKKIMKPLNKLKKTLKQQRLALADAKFELLKAKGAASKAKSKDLAAKHVKRADEMAALIPKLENDVRTSYNLHENEAARLQGEAANGSISPIFYERIPGVKGRVKFKKSSDRLKFRKQYESELEMATHARAYYQTIMNQSAEDTISQIMGTLLGRHGENPLNQRTLMIPDQVLYENKFLSKNLGLNVANYRNVLGRRTFLKNVYKDVSLDGGIQPIAEELRLEFLSMKEALDNKLTALRAEPASKANAKQIKATEKELSGLHKKFESAKSDMNSTYNKMMGRVSGSQKQREFTSILRNFAVSVKLGAVPLTMVTDMMAIPFKHGVWPSLRDGLFPVLSNIKNLIKHGKGDKYIQNAPHANLGLNHVLTGYADRNWAGSAQPYTPISGSLINGMEKIAHVSQNIAGTNQVENFFQEWTASTFQSKVIGWMMDFQAGKLKPRDREKLLVYGLQPEDWADKFVKNWKDRGADGNGFGGYQSRFWEWADKEASVKMSETVMRATRDTVIRRGMFDAPFALDDPIIGTMFMFKGWVMASLTRYLTPLMQRPDSEKLIGSVLMLMAGSMVTPLRRIAKGEDPIQEDDNMFWNAMVDGGIFSFLTDSIEEANVLMGGNLLKDIRNDRYKDRTIAGVLAGPVGGMGDDLVHVIKMMASGNYNQTDVNKAARLIPATQPWYFRGVINKMVESTDLPKTERDAERANS